MTPNKDTKYAIYNCTWEKSNSVMQHNKSKVNARERERERTDGKLCRRLEQHKRNQNRKKSEGRKERPMTLKKVKTRQQINSMFH